MNKMILFDAHQDIVLYELENIILTQTSFEKIKNTPIKLVNGSIFPNVFALKNKKEQIQDLQRQLKMYQEKIAADKDFMLIKNREDLDMLLSSEKIGILLHVEGLDYIDSENMSLIDEVINGGVRSIGLTWNNDNLISGAAGSKNGLSDFGKIVVKKLVEDNCLIDLAHISRKGFFDVMDIAGDRAYVSHGNIAQFCETQRNLSIKQLEELKKYNSVFGLFFSGKYVLKEGQPTVQNILEQLRFSQKDFSENIMIGSDFGGITSGYVKGLESIDCFDNFLERVEHKHGLDFTEHFAYKNYLEFLYNRLDT